MKYKIMPSPIGPLTIVASENAIVAVLWDKDNPNRVRLGELEEDKTDPLLLKAEKQLNEYFSGRRQSFALPMKAKGTPFQEAVWKLLNEIPYGTTVTYKDIAHKVKNPLAVRAVGSAIGRNPISIIIPCHRVIASDGSLAGFAGGLPRKQKLLTHESRR